MYADDVWSEMLSGFCPTRCSRFTHCMYFHRVSQPVIGDLLLLAPCVFACSFLSQEYGMTDNVATSSHAACRAPVPPRFFGCGSVLAESKNRCECHEREWDVSSIHFCIQGPESCCGGSGRTGVEIFVPLQTMHGSCNGYFEASGLLISPVFIGSQSWMSLGGLLYRYLIRQNHRFSERWNTWISLSSGHHDSAKNPKTSHSQLPSLVLLGEATII
jgi:hypothetical protein